MVDENTGELDAQGSSSPEQNSGVSTNNANDTRDGYVPISQMHESNAITRKQSFDKGYQRGRNEAASMASQSREPNHENVSQSQSQSSFSRDDIGRMLQDEAQKLEAKRHEESQRQQLEEWGRKVEYDFLRNSEGYQAENPDFNPKEVVEQVSEVSPYAFAYSAGLDNAAETWDHLIKNNPMQLVNLEQMVTSNSAHKQRMALDEIKKVSDRLKLNKSGRDSGGVPAPIDRVEKTNHGVGQADSDGWDHFRSLYSSKKR